MTPPKGQALVQRPSPIAAMVQSTGPQVSMHDLLELDGRIREWVRDHLHTQRFETCTLFQRTQEAGKVLEDRIRDAQARMPTHLQQTPKAT